MSTFEEFWRLYPRRVAKRAAQKEWDREIRAGTEPETIIEGLRRQLPMLMRKDPQFIPHARTWLHQGRWEDEPEPIGGNSYAGAAYRIMREDHERGNDRPSGGNVELFPVQQGRP